MKVKQPGRFYVFGQVLLESGLYKLWHHYLKVCVIGTGFTCFSSVIVENAIVILTLFRKEQINAVDATHTEAYQRNILSKFLERMRESTEVGKTAKNLRSILGLIALLFGVSSLGIVILGQGFVIN